MTAIPFTTTGNHYDDDLLTYQDVWKIVDITFNKYGNRSDCDRVEAVQELLNSHHSKSEKACWIGAELIADDLDI